MPLNLDNHEPIDESDPAHEPWLSKLQGNILRSHGRDHAACIFFSFGDAEAGRRTLSSLAGAYLTSAATQAREAARYRATGIPGWHAGNLLLTARAYERFGVDLEAAFGDEAWDGPHQGAEKADRQAVSRFRTSMRESGPEDFNDPDPSLWSRGYREPIDAMLLLADDDERRLERLAQSAIDEIGQAHVVRTVERGHVRRNDDGTPVEPFGFVDGTSQPLFLRSDFAVDAHGQRCLRDGSPILVWDPFAPLARVLVRDPLMAGTDPDCFGSFMVFRKLAQDVGAFHERVCSLAETLGLMSDRDRVAAMVVGRFKDGTPLTLSPRTDPALASANDFDYALDIRGRKCPRHAHIRKVNPRGDSEDLATERLRQIARRGIPYGSASSAPSPEAVPAQAETGLLFMCFQASIRQQFAHIQRRWSTDPDFATPHVGFDRIAGTAPPAKPEIEAPRWPRVYGTASAVAAPFESAVRFLGGEFFFAPSLPYLAGLASARP